MQTWRPARPRPGGWRDAPELWLEAERDQLVLWIPVALGVGIACWFVLPTRAQWLAALLAAGAVGCAALALGRGGRLARAVAVAAALFACGLALIWVRAERVAGPPLVRPTIAEFEARVERVDPLPARELVRLRLAPDPAAKLPAHVRVNLSTGDMPQGLAAGATIRLRARLMPPPEPAVPGAYDYGRVAWFDGIGATGRGFAPVKVLRAGSDAAGGPRQRLSRHIQDRSPGGAGAVAAALATGDQGAIPIEDADAMRNSGLAHLLSVSGLHITAVVGATMVIVLRLLALSPWLAMRWRLPLVAGGAGAVAAIGYTWLTGAEVPTVRSCVAALLVLAALALGRHAITLRLVAAGALVVLLLYPEAIAGPSFQLSFAAVTAIVALHEQPRVAALFARAEESRGRRLLRHLGSLLLTGVVVELALMPIGLFHFHKAGLYGALANIVAIPLTTFVTMPLEALALLLDPLGLAAPFWWGMTWSLELLLWIAHRVSSLPGAVAALPAMPSGAYALVVAGGLWVALWRTRWRAMGWLPVLAGLAWTWATPAPDLLVTGDGRHLGVRMADGAVALLRDRTGDYASDTLSENAGGQGTPLLLSGHPEARCNRDLCLVRRRAGGREWRVLATRSAYLVPVADLIRACRTADIVVSERRLPRGCTPRWLRLDAPTLRRTGGVAVSLATRTVATVREPGDEHPWRNGAPAASLAPRSSDGERKWKTGAFGLSRKASGPAMRRIIGRRSTTNA
nr:ComEC/Rec2 family competence protein [Sphingomonas aracearum]